MEHASGKADCVGLGYDIGVGRHFVYGELQYVLSVLREDYPNVEKPTLRATAWEIVSSLYAEPHFGCLSLDDPKPFGGRSITRDASTLPVGIIYIRPGGANANPSLRSDHRSRVEEVLWRRRERYLSDPTRAGPK